MPVRKATPGELLGGKFIVQNASCLPPKWIEHMKEQAAARKAAEAAARMADSNEGGDED